MLPSISVVCDPIRASLRTAARPPNPAPATTTRAAPPPVGVCPLCPVAVMSSPPPVRCAAPLLPVPNKYLVPAPGGGVGAGCPAGRAGAGRGRGCWVLGGTCRRPAGAWVLGARRDVPASGRDAGCSADGCRRAPAARDRGSLAKAAGGSCGPGLARRGKE